MFVRSLLDKLHLIPRTEQRKQYKNAANTFNETGYTKDHREAIECLITSMEKTLRIDVEIEIHDRRERRKNEILDVPEVSAEESKRSDGDSDSDKPVVADEDQPSHRAAEITVVHSSGDDADGSGDDADGLESKQQIDDGIEEKEDVEIISDASVSFLSVRLSRDRKPNLSSMFCCVDSADGHVRGRPKLTWCQIRKSKPKRGAH